MSVRGSCLVPRAHFRALFIFQQSSPSACLKCEPKFVTSWLKTLQPFPCAFRRLSFAVISRGALPKIILCYWVLFIFSVAFVSMCNCLFYFLDHFFVVSLLCVKCQNVRDHIYFMWICSSSHIVSVPVNISCTKKRFNKLSVARWSKARGVYKKKERFSWVCGWTELKEDWRMIWQTVPPLGGRVQPSHVTAWKLKTIQHPCWWVDRLWCALKSEFHVSAVTYTIHHLKGFEKGCETGSLRRGLCSKTQGISQGVTDRGCREGARRALSANRWWAL